jgi:hypothetical protein
VRELFFDTYYAKKLGRRAHDLVALEPHFAPGRRNLSAILATPTTRSSSRRGSAGTRIPRRATSRSDCAATS